MGLSSELQKLIEISQKRICLLYQPNDDRLRKIARELGFSSASNDRTKICRLHIDEQTCFNWPLTYMNEEGQIRHICFIESKDSFIFPESMEKRIDWINRKDYNILNYGQVWAGQLSVPNSWNDTLRIVECDITNMHRTTKHILSGDKHPALSVSNLYNYKASRNGTYDGIYYQKGDNPSIFTILTVKSVYHPLNNPDGMWIPQHNIDKAWEYVVRLTKSQYEIDPVDVLPLTLWPVHGIMEGWSSLVDPLIWEVILLHAYARQIDWTLIEKGQSPLTEFHGAYEAEVNFPEDQNTQPKTKDLDIYLDYDLLVFSGQAAGNCFRRSVEQQYEYLKKKDPESIKKMIVLINTTSCIPGTEAGFLRSLEKMKKDGLRVMTTEEYTQLLNQMENDNLL